MKILIVGHGFVGRAVEYGFSTVKNSITIVDPKYGNSLSDIDLADYEVTFVCVPTPMNDDGSIDSSILDSVMNIINSKYRTSDHLVIIKSTVTPDVLKQYSDFGVIYNPEFLREATALEDFVKPEFHIFGGLKSWDCNRAEELYNNHSNCSRAPAFYMSYTEASLAKYAINSFLALKVTFFNQLYDTAEASGADFSRIVRVVESDKRIGSSHTRVPGFDGRRGYGGSCFPKDTSAIINYTDKLSLVEETVKVNNAYRKSYELNQREKDQNIRFVEN
jgi:UDPglucose 6-dehydrogenase